MIKTPLSTMIGGAFWTPCATILGLSSQNLTQLIKSIFANNEQGFAYDPNDLTTLYQDASGTIPVTAAGQPVGLMLDKSKGLVLGGELFNQADAVTVGESSSLGSGKFRIYSSAGAVSGVQLLSKLSVGKMYVVNFTIESVANIGSGITAESTVNQVAQTTTGIKSVIIIATNKTFFLKRLGVCDYIVSNVSVKELAGNHAYQTVSASRPVLTNHVNLFNDSEVFSAWIRNDGVALSTPNPKYPNAVKLTRGASSVFIHRTAMTTIGTYTLTGLFKNVVGTVNAILANTTAVPMTKVGVTADGLDVYQSTQTIASVPNSSVTGIVLYNANDSVEVYGLDVRVTQQNSTLPPYQKVVGSTQFDTVGFPNYLLFDGADDFLQTNNIDFTATDKVSLFAGLRKSQAVGVNAILYELSVTAGSANAGSFRLLAPSASSQLAYRSCGSIDSDAYTNSSEYAESKGLCVTSLSQISTDINILRVNGAQVASSASDQGTVKYGSYPLYIGRRGGNTLPFNGHLYSLIGISRLTTDSETIALEKSIAKNVGVTLSV